MKKLLLLTKTLLAVALLCVGQNAWGAWTTVFTQDYENSETIATGWSDPNSRLSASQQNRVGGSTHYGKINAANTNGTTCTYAGLTNTAIVGTEYGSSDQYKIEFDMAIIPANASSSSGAQTPVFTLYDSSNNSLCHWQVTTAAKTAAANSTGSFYLGSAGSETASFTANTSPYWYHITIEAASESSTTMTVKDISTTTETEYTLSESFIYLGKFTYVTGKTQGGICLDNLTVSIYTDSEIVSAPTIGDPVYAGANRTITITGGVSSKSNAVTTYYTIDGTDPSASNKEGSFTTSTKDVTISSNCTVKAITISSESVASNITSKAVTVGKLTLNAPVVSSIVGFTKSGDTYYPQYTFSSDQSSVMGTPDVTYSYTIAGDPNATPNPTGYSEAKAGELIVTVNAEGYNSASAEAITVLPYSLTKSYDFSEEYTLNSNWSKNSDKASMPNGDYAISGKRYTPTAAAIETGTNVSGTLFEGLAFSQNRANYYYFVQGLGIGQVGGDKVNNTTITIAGLTENDYTVYRKYNSGNTQTDVVVAGNSTWNLGKMSGTGAHVLHGIFVYSPDQVAIAIADCKKYETSSDFATAVEAESFSTAAEVYAFHTAWQIAKAKASGSTDITKVIRNAAIADVTDWTNARIWSGEKYTGAPDEYYFDQYQATLDAYQTVYGLPAGTYKIKAATRGSASASGNIYVYAEGQVNKNAAINLDGNTGGTLGQGWSWTEIEFTLTETSDLKVGFWCDASASSQWAGCDDWHLTKTGDVVKLNAAGYATYSANYDVEVSGAKAYTAVLDFANSKITCSEITSNKVPAGNGVLLYGDANADVTLSITTGAAALATNNLKATTLYDGSLATKGSNNYYALDGDTFKQYSGTAFVHNKAYFEVAGGSVQARSMRISFGDITGVDNVEAASEAKAKEGKFIENGKLVIVKNGVKYNAAGQQVK